MLQITVNDFTGGDVDYDSGPYTVTIPAGQIRMSFDVPITNDNTCELNETFILNIVPVLTPNCVVIANPNQTSITIIDDDGKCCDISRANACVYDISNELICLSFSL